MGSRIRVQKVLLMDDGFGERESGRRWFFLSVDLVFGENNFEGVRTRELTWCVQNTPT